MRPTALKTERGPSQIKQAIISTQLHLHRSNNCRVFIFQLASALAAPRYTSAHAAHCISIMAACYPTVIAACPPWVEMHSMSDSDSESDESEPSPSPSPDRSVYHAAPAINSIVHRSKPLPGRLAPLIIRLVSSSLPPAHHPALVSPPAAVDTNPPPSLQQPHLSNCTVLRLDCPVSPVNIFVQAAEIAQAAQAPARAQVGLDVRTASVVHAPPLLPPSLPLLHPVSPLSLGPDSNVTDSSGCSSGDRTLLSNLMSNSNVSICSSPGLPSQQHTLPQQPVLPQTLEVQQPQVLQHAPPQINSLPARPSFAPSPRQWRGRRSSPSPSRSLSRSPSPNPRSPSPVHRPVRKCYSPTLSPSPAPRSPSPTPLHRSHSTMAMRGRSFSRSPSYMRNSTSPPMAAHDLRGHARSPSGPPSRSPSPSPIPPPRIRGQTQQQEPNRGRSRQPQHRRNGSSGSDQDLDDGACDRGSWESGRQRSRGISPEDSRHWPVASAPVVRASSQRSKQALKGSNGRASNNSLAGHSRRREVFEEEGSMEAERYGKRNGQHKGRSGSVDRRSRSRSRSRWSPPRGKWSRSRSRSPGRPSTAAFSGGAAMYGGGAAMYNGGGGGGFGMMWPQYQQQQRGGGAGSSACMMMEDAAWEQGAQEAARQQQQPPRPPPRGPRYG